MIKHLTLLCLFLVVLTSGSYATHVAGGHIQYEVVQDSVYDFYVTIYRSCMGVPLSNPSSVTKIRCKSGTSSQGVTLKLESIDEITHLCKTAARRCAPKNTTNTGEGIEEHLFTTRIDFRKSPYKALLSCGDLIFETGQCCRSSAITTGIANSNFYIYLSFNPSNNFQNTSPKYNKHPRFYLACNQPMYLDFGAQDADGDSLSYELVQPRTGISGTASYNGNYSARNPIDTYNPTKGSPNPNANPPHGFYLDPSSGMLIFTPTKCDNISSMVVEISEWRKDSAGKYKLIGTSLRESNLLVDRVGDNNSPTLFVSDSYQVCEGDSLTFQINSADKVVIPPPPIPKPDPDTVRLTYHGNIDGASFEVENDTAVFQSARFSWRPKTGTARVRPYTFVVTAQDNFCPYPGTRSKHVEVYVVDKPETGIISQELSCGVYELRVNDSLAASNSEHSWAILDSSGMRMIDSTRAHFSSNQGTTSSNERDTLLVTSDGYYILELTTSIGSCFTRVYDTILSNGTFELLNAKSIRVCSGDSFDITPTAGLDTLITQYNWVDGKTSVNQRIFRSQITSGERLVRLTAKGTDGCIRRDSLYVNTKYAPELLNISDTAVCGISPPAFEVIDQLDSGLVVNSYLWSNGDTTQKVSLDKSGNYEVIVWNSCGSDTNSFRLDIDSVQSIDLGKDQFLCDQDSLFLGLKKQVEGTSYSWNSGDTIPGIFVRKNDVYILTAYNTCGTWTDSIEVFLDFTPALNWPDTTFNCDGNLEWLVASHPSATYKWSDGSSNDSFVVKSEGVVVVEVIAKFCGKHSDTTEIINGKTPVVDLGSDTTLKKPFNYVLDAGEFLGTYQWSTGEKTRMITVSDFGAYWVELMNDCGADRDTIELKEFVNISGVTTSDIEIYPNPGDGVFKIRFDSSPRIINVYDSHGKKVEFDSHTTDNVMSIDLSNCTNGVYTLQFQHDNFTITRNLILIR